MCKYKDIDSQDSKQHEKGYQAEYNSDENNRGRGFSVCKLEMF